MGEWFGFIGGFLTSLGMVPQVWRLFTMKRAYEISLTFTMSFAVGILFWLLYGITYNLISIIIWNTVALILSCAMLYAKIRWG